MLAWLSARYFQPDEFLASRTDGKMPGGPQSAYPQYPLALAEKPCGAFLTGTQAGIGKNIAYQTASFHAVGFDAVAAPPMAQYESRRCIKNRRIEVYHRWIAMRIEFADVLSFHRYTCRGQDVAVESHGEFVFIAVGVVGQSQNSAMQLPDMAG